MGLGRTGPGMAGCSKFLRLCVAGLWAVVIAHQPARAGDPVADEIRACSENCRITLPEGLINATEPWIFDDRSVHLESAGASTTVQWKLPSNPDGSPPSFALSTIASQHVTMENINFALRSDSAVPHVGWLAGRQPREGGEIYVPSVGKWRIETCSFSVKARKSTVYLVGIEGETMIGCGFSNSWKPSSEEPGYALFITDSDMLNVPGEYEHISDYQTSASHIYINCNLGQYAWSISALYPVASLGIGTKVHDLHWIGGSVSSNAYMTAVTHVRGTGCYNLFFDAPNWEGKNTAYGIIADVPVTSLWWVGGLAQSQRAALRVEASAWGKMEPARLMSPTLIEYDSAGKWNGSREP